MSEPVRLTSFSRGAGCGCKIAPAVLHAILKDSGHGHIDPRIMVDHSKNDDAAVFDLGNGRALISTTDFFTPVVDDPFDHGRVAATNALSDVYAMGGTPLLAIAILGWPVDRLPAEMAAQVIAGARSVCNDARIALAGGHSIDAPEPFFGLAVTGEAPIGHIKTNSGARPGDLLALTKPVGTGILATALKRGKIKDDDQRILIDLMTRSNAVGSEFGKLEGVHAMTDITGFGLLGHLLEMCDGSGVSASLELLKIPRISGIMEYVAQGHYPDGTFRNWKSIAPRVKAEENMEVMMTLADPQTSGGLLIAFDPSSAKGVSDILTGHDLPFHVIGRMHAGTDRESTITVL